MTFCVSFFFLRPDIVFSQSWRRGGISEIPSRFPSHFFILQDFHGLSECSIASSSSVRSASIEPMSSRTSSAERDSPDLEDFNEGMNQEMIRPVTRRKSRDETRQETVSSIRSRDEKPRDEIQDQVNKKKNIDSNSHKF